VLYFLLLDDPPKEVRMNNIMLNGTLLEVREVWVCACSSNGSGDSEGDHLWSEPTPKCYRKGGEYESQLFDPVTGEWAGFLPTD
jgi:hypothetical protein